MNNQALIVLQVRLGSRRLPGKALSDIAGRSILERCLARLRASQAAPIVVATPTKKEDDAVAAVAIANGVPVVRGPEADVLKRFLVAAEMFTPDYIIRATADNPAVDIDAPRRVLEALVEGAADYAIESGLPYGSAVEAVTVDALMRADAMAVEASDREHVTPLVRRDRLFHALEIPAPKRVARPDLRLSIDTLHDLSYMRDVFGALADPRAETPLAEIIAAADSLAAEMLAVAQ
ncbi:MAG: cytidylyltransferase domain-containing protein [Vicinamibacterales bacterium]